MVLQNQVMKIDSYGLSMPVMGFDLILFAHSDASRSNSLLPLYTTTHRYTIHEIHNPVTVTAEATLQDNTSTVCIMVLLKVLIKKSR